MCVLRRSWCQFQAAKETIYSEVAALISQNESQPHYLISLFRDLQQLTTSTQRSLGLAAIEALVSQYLHDDEEGGEDGVRGGGGGALHLEDSDSIREVYI